MTTPSVSAPIRTPRLTGRSTLARAVRSEWSKLVTLRSTWVTSVITIALTVALSSLVMSSMAGVDEWADQSGEQVIGGFALGKLVVLVFGALVVTTEYSSGQIRSSLAATPKRVRLFAAKSIVVAVWSFLLGFLTTLFSWGLSLSLTGVHALSFGEASSYMWGTGLASMGIALLAMSVGFLLRSTAGSITVLMVLLFVIRIPLNMAPERWEWLTKYSMLLPDIAVSTVADPCGRITDPPHFDAWAYQLSFALWVIVPMVIAAMVFQRRDA